MTTADNFNQEFAKLNPEQKLAVTTLEGPVLVFAGPGTGKTQVLTLRLANLLAQGLAEPENILALSYTKAAAVNMQKRLAGIIGAAAFKVNCNTFHGFCQEIIETHGEFFPFAHDSAVLDELTQREIMEEILQNLPLTALQPAGDKFYYLKTLTQKITILKQENVSLAQYQTLLQQARADTAALIAAEQSKKKPSSGKITKWEKTLLKQEELLLVYQAYQEKLAAKNLHDYADMILTTITALRDNPDLLATYQEQYQYLLVDEYQDTNNSQNEIVKLLMSHWGDQANIFAVGDAQQSIYRFQGANLENFLHFEKIYPQAKKIQLKTGYRCGNLHYQLAQFLISRSAEMQAADLAPVKLANFADRPGLPTVLTAYQNPEVELIEIAQKIKKLHEQDSVPLDQIAIIYHNNAESAKILAMMAHYALPVEIEGGSDVLCQSEIAHWLQLWRLLANLENPAVSDYYLSEILWQPWWNFPPLAVMKILTKAKTEHLSLWAVLSSADSELSTFAANLLAWKQASQQKTASLFNYSLMTESGLLTWIETQPHKVHLLTYFYSLQKKLQAWETGTKEALSLFAALNKIDLMQAANLKLPAEDLDVQKEAVALATAHKAKGREWRYVFIYGVNQNNWNKKQRELLPLPAGILQEQSGAEDAEEEARRLLFVALTRAKEQTQISWHEKEDDATLAAPKLPSAFIYELEEKTAAGLVTLGTVEITGDKAQTEMANLLKEPATPNFDAQAREYLQARARELVLSPSMLNDYLEDPSMFWRRYLLRAPREPATTALEFGNSLHLALERWYQPRTVGGDFLPLAEVQEIFRRDFSAKNLNEQDKQNFLLIGQNSLAQYAKNYLSADANFATLAVEKKFGLQKKLLVDTVPVGGKIDRLDVIDPIAHTLRVIDYKSGQAQSENELLGKTASAKLSAREKLLPECLHHRTKRQLLFYKLLCELDTSMPYQVDYGLIDFVKATDNCKPVRRQFSLPASEVAALKDLIKEVYQEIIDLKFLEEKC